MIVGMGISWDDVASVVTTPIRLDAAIVKKSISTVAPVVNQANSALHNAALALKPAVTAPPPPLASNIPLILGGVGVIAILGIVLLKGRHA